MYALIFTMSKNSIYHFENGIFYSGLRKHMFE